MPIQDIIESARLPVVGKIRLGIIKKTQKGSEYPSETPHFVLNEVKEVEDIYGAEPKELEIYFPSDDENVVIPNWYKWYAGGMKGKDGQRIGGKLQCYGDGREAHFLAKRDPVTREVPVRKCLGSDCPDWKRDGTQQCKPSMSVFFFLPRVSVCGLYQIDTTSWIAINSFVSQIMLIKKQFGRLTGIPFKIYRDPTPVTFVDSSGKEQTREHYIMKIKPNELFVKHYGKEVEAKIAALKPLVWKPEPATYIEAPMEDNWPVSEDSAPALINTQTGEIKEVVDLAREAAEAPELQELFIRLCAIRKATNSEKTRLLTARKFEKEGNIKAALKAYLEKEVSASVQKTEEKKQDTLATVDPGGLI
jgi:hypothetical protein